MTITDERLPQQFRSKMRPNEESGCWEWQASLDRDGYGRLCVWCPVAASCLADALARRDLWAVLGGTTAEERATLLRKPRIRRVRVGAG